jgi:hypothetical protein
VLLQFALQVGRCPRVCARRGGQLTRQHLELFRFHWQRMSLPVLVELQAVFQVAQELVGGCQAAILGPREQPLIVQPEKREQSSAVPDPRLAPSVQALQALHQKLDIPDPPVRQLNVNPGRTGAAGRKLLPNPGPGLGH